MKEETLDMNGLVIYPECIVRPFYTSHRDIVLTEENEDEHTYDYQGLVISIDEKGVAVFFDLEVSRYSMRPDEDDPDGTGRTQEEKVKNWDRKNWTDGPTKLLNRQIKIQDCPRVKYYNPKDLRVEDNWIYTNNFSRRAGGPNNYCHTYCILKIPLIRGGSPCMTPDCKGIATRLSFQNIWGSMYPVYTCVTCDEKHHVKWMDTTEIRKDWKPFDYSKYPRE